MTEDQIKHMEGLAAQSPVLPPSGVEEWRCFHCNEVFTDKDAAREHFGFITILEPGCIDPMRGNEKALRRREMQSESLFRKVCDQRDQLFNELKELRALSASVAGEPTYTEDQVRAAVEVTIQKMLDGGELIDNRNAAPFPALDPGTVGAWKHKKRGTVYRVLHNYAPMQEEQTEGRRLDDEPMVVYQDIASGAVYVRPVVEFYDGRFEQIAATTLPKSTLASLPLEWRKEAVRHSNAAAEDDCDLGGDEWWLHRESSRIYKKCANALDDALLASPAPGKSEAVRVERVVFRNFPGRFADIASAFAFTVDGKEWRLSEDEIVQALNAQPIVAASVSANAEARASELVTSTVHTCKKCGCDLNGEAAQVGDEVWCHSCADAGLGSLHDRVCE